MTEKLAVIINDAMDTYNVRQLDMQFLKNLIVEENSEVLGVSSLPYTASSNPKIWANFDNKDRFWIKEGTSKWSFPAGAFNREEEKAVDKAERTWNRTDFPTTFIWDELLHKGVDATAIQIPIVLPPYSFNNVEGYDMGDAWFPHDPEQIRRHGQEVPKDVVEHAEAGKDFIACSIQIPDKLLHVMGESDTSKREAAEIGAEFDEKFEWMWNRLLELDYDVIVLGDHGSPFPGNIKIPETKQFVPNHRKNSVIISNRDDWDLPTYTEDLYGFMHEKMDVEACTPDEEKQQELEEEVVQTLKANLSTGLLSGSNDSLFMFTGGKEALVISHMLLNKVSEEGEAPIHYGVIDTGNHFDEMYKFRNEYADRHGIDLKKTSSEALLQDVILNEDDPRGYHGNWDDDKELPDNLEGIATENTSPEDWTVDTSCGRVKVEGVRNFIDQGFSTLITGQRKGDATVGESAGLKNERTSPEKHTRLNPLFNWSTRNVWRYIDKHDLDYPILYNRGYDHTDAKCCTLSPDEVSEYGSQDVDPDKAEVRDKLQQLGYI